MSLIHFNTANPNYKCAEYISPGNSYKTFEGENTSGFWVTIVDTLNQSPIPEVAVLFEKDSTITSNMTDYKRNYWLHFGLTNEEGSIWINSTKMDTVFVTYIGFQNQYFYRNSASIDSVVIFLNECLYSSH
jgi:hypothetical protein